MSPPTASVHGLVALAVGGLIFALQVWRQRDVTVALYHFPSGPRGV
jgi:hypothetical protein